MSDALAAFLPGNLEVTPKPYIRDKAPLICLVLYINLEFDDEKHRVEQINFMFSNYRHDDYMAQLMEIIQSDKDANACYQVAMQAVQDGFIEKFDPDFDTDRFDDEGQNIEKFYTVSFLAWAEQAGYKLPEYVMPDLDHKVEYYFQKKHDRDEDKKNFVKITKDEFDKRMSEPLWVMTDALLYLLGYKNSQSEDKKASFLRYNRRIERIKKYALDALKTEELKLYDYENAFILTEAGDIEKQFEEAFFASKVRPKDFVKWALALPINLPVLKECVGNAFGEGRSKIDMVKDLLEEEQNFRFCGPSDDPDEITGVTVSYRYLMAQIKTQIRPYLPENMALQLDKVEVEVNNIYSAYEAQAQLHALLPDIESALENGNKASNENTPPPVQKSTEAPFQIKFLDVSGEVVLNDIFTVAKPETNGQNYKIIRYLIQNPNRFVTAGELKEKALDGKDLDKRLTDFVAQINMNKDMGKLFFDTGKDSIRLNNPVTAERMAEKNVKRVRIKPA
ncbi:MAG: hypothetical protein GC137_10375 [Alphaproteobacteria bacterium]|nr:hypothetical protein [Alphaproteobacteria bacterium]